MPNAQSRVVHTDRNQPIGHERKRSLAGSLFMDTLGQLQASSVIVLNVRRHKNQIVSSRFYVAQSREKSQDEQLFTCEIFVRTP